MSIAKIYVKAWINSKHFTLTEYEGKDEFYDVILDAYLRFMEELSSLTNKYDEFLLSSLKNLKRVNRRCTDPDMPLEMYKRFGLEVPMLTLDKAHRYLAQILYYIDVARGQIAVKRLPYYFSRYEKSDERKGTTIAPFVTPTGIFGMNTWLYMFYHGIYPLAS